MKGEVVRAVPSAAELEHLDADGDAGGLELPEEAGDAGKLYMLLQSRTIVAAALLESPGFFWGIIHLLTHSPLSLIAAILLILGVAAHFPTRSRVIHWIENQLRLVDEERRFGREPIR